MSLDPNPSPQTLDKAVKKALQKMRKHVKFGRAVYEAAQDLGISDSVLFREMSRRSAIHRKSLATKKAQSRDRRAA